MGALECEAPAGWSPAGAPEADDRLGSHTTALDASHGTPAVKPVEALELEVVWCRRHHRPFSERVVAKMYAAARCGQAVST